MGFRAKARFAQAVAAAVCIGVLAACGGGGTGAVPSPAKSAAPSQPVNIISQNGNSITLTGTISAMITGGFQIQGGPGVGYLHIYVNSQTTITGPQPYVGEYVEVIGTGTPSTSVTASSVAQLQTPTPSPSASPTAAPSASPTAAPTGTVITLPSGVFLQTGQIASVAGNKLSVQTGKSCGYVYVYLSSSTVEFDGAPAAGEYAALTGTGNRCATINANTVSLGSTPLASATFAGTVTQATSYGFAMSTTSGTIPVALTSSTVLFGSTLMVGSSVTVTGLGSATQGLSATQVAVAPPPTPTPNPSSSPTPTPGPIAMQHVTVAGFIYGYGGTPTSVPLSSITPYVNWAFTDEAHAPLLRTNGIQVLIYTNFWRNYTTDNPNLGYTDLQPGGAHASAEALDCNNNPVYDSNYGGGYEADARTSSVLAHAQIVTSYIENEYAGNYDAIFADDTGAVDGITLPCNYVESTYDQATNAISSALGVPMWVNALGAAANPANAIDLAQPSNVLGAECEECYSTNGTTGDSVQTGTSWINVENAEIGMAAQHRVFWDYARATGSASGEIPLRVYTYASLLLGYDPSYTMFEEALSTPSQFPVMPETGLVPQQPLTTQSSVAGYQGAGGAYFREFGACYYRGQYVDRCAVAVNPGSSSVPIPSTSYNHSLVLSGSGVLDGGTATFNGPAVTQLAPFSAAILFP